MPSFYNGKRFFLTYPRTDRTINECIAFLQSAGDLVYYVVCRELHEDGMPHLHACVEFRTVFRGSHSALDWDGRHPNKQDPRKWKACIQYCKKGGDFEEGPIDVVMDNALKGMDYVLECAGHDLQESWYSWCVNRKISAEYAKFFWTRVHQDEFTIRDDEHDGVVVNSLNNLLWNDGWKTLILIGVAGCGKTTWAKRRVPKPALFVTHVDGLKSFRAGYHRSIIFDDVDFKHYPRTSQVHLVDFDNPRHIHCRHSVASIPAKVPKVFTANVDPVDLGDPAIRRRCHVIRIQ